MAREVDAARVAARALKERLSVVDAAGITVDALGLHDAQVTRAELEALIEPLAQRTIRACRAALKDAGVRATELGGVVLVGGSTRPTGSRPRRSTAW